MRILIATPIPLDAVGGPASIARLLKHEFEALGDTVTVATLKDSERKLPIPLRQIALFFRALPLCMKHDAVLLLDPVSTGISFALAASLTGRQCVLRVGGDFLWETYVERTQEPLLLSEFYRQERPFSFFERMIRIVTWCTIRLSDAVAFTTPWLCKIWYAPYALHGKITATISNPSHTAEAQIPAKQKMFLASGRPMRIKNIEILEREVWPRIKEHYPDAILETAPRGHAAYEQALKDSYAVILPSLSDVSPNSILEAIRYGKPFIATKDTGLYDKYKENGIFIDTRNTDELVAAIQELLTEKGYAEAIQRVGTEVSSVTPGEIAQAFRKLLLG